MRVNKLIMFSTFPLLSSIANINRDRDDERDCEIVCSFSVSDSTVVRLTLEP